MPVCNTIKPLAYRRRRSDASAQETTSSVANLVEAAAASRESLADEPTPAQQEQPNETKKCVAFKGFVYTFLCSFFITLSSVIVKKLTYISPGQLSLVRNVGVLLGNIPIVVYSGEHPLGPKSHRILLLIRSFLGATALYMNLLAYRLLPLAEAAIIMSTLPVVVSVSARIFLSEPCGLVQTIAVFITLTGVMLSIQLPELIINKSFGSTFTKESVLGISLAVGCVLLLSVTFVTIRKMKDVHFSVVMVYLGFLGAIENAAITGGISYYRWPRCGLDVAWVLMIAVFGFVGNSCLTLAIQSEAVGIISVLKASLDIFMAMIFQAIFFGTAPSTYSVCGAALVVISVLIIGIRKWMTERTQNTPQRERVRSFNEEFAVLNN